MRNKQNSKILKNYYYGEFILLWAEIMKVVNVHINVRLRRRVYRKHNVIIFRCWTTCFVLTHICAPSIANEILFTSLVWIYYTCVNKINKKLKFNNENDNVSKPHCDYIMSNVWGKTLTPDFRISILLKYFFITGLIFAFTTYKLADWFFVLVVSTSILIHYSSWIGEYLTIFNWNIDSKRIQRKMSSHYYLIWFRYWELETECQSEG